MNGYLGLVKYQEDDEAVTTEYSGDKNKFLKCDYKFAKSIADRYGIELVKIEELEGE